MTKASIAILAYNQLYYTKICIDSLLTYTNDVDYELITVNNGSSDGTKEYFESLPHKKKINYDTNVGIEKAINAALEASEGEYFVLINNDLILTTNWLSNIVKILDSDPKVGAVVPASNTRTNDQIVFANYTNTEELQKFAKEYNVSNPRKWEERIDLTMYLVAFRTKELKDMGALDLYYSPGGYDDDDLSFRYRRSGYKLILAYDTYVHHYCSVTMKEHYADNDHMTRNHLYFMSKFGVDVYKVISVNYLPLINLNSSKEGDLDFLSIGKASGNTMLRAKNILKRSEKVNSIKTTYYSLEQLYLTDLRTICDRVIYNSLDNIDTELKDEKYDFVFVEENLKSISNIDSLLKSLKNNLKDDGELILTFNLDPIQENDERFKTTIENLLQLNNYSISKVAANEIAFMYIIK